MLIGLGVCCHSPDGLSPGLFFPNSPMTPALSAELIIETPVGNKKSRSALTADRDVLTYLPECYNHLPSIFVLLEMLNQAEVDLLLGR